MYWDDFHEPWWKGIALAKEEPIKFGAELSRVGIY